MSLLLIVILLVLVLGGLPQVGWHQHGYAPSSIGFLLLIVLIVLLLTGRLNL